MSLIHPEDREKTAAASEIALAGGPRYDVEYRVVRPDGIVAACTARGREHGTTPAVPFASSASCRTSPSCGGRRTSCARARRASARSSTVRRTAFSCWTSQLNVRRRQPRRPAKSLGYNREELDRYRTRRDFDVGRRASMTAGRPLRQFGAVDAERRLGEAPRGRQEARPCAGALADRLARTRARANRICRASSHGCCSRARCQRSAGKLSHLDSDPYGESHPGCATDPAPGPHQLAAGRTASQGGHLRRVRIALPTAVRQINTIRPGRIRSACRG